MNNADEFNELFNRLDVYRDGILSRTELFQAAQHLGWHWHYTALYAVLDLLTLEAPMSRNEFISYMHQISLDPNGPYGQVLLHSALFTESMTSMNDHKIRSVDSTKKIPNNASGGDILVLLERIAGNEIAHRYRKILQDLDGIPVKIPIEKTGLLIIDPQYSFTSGVWMQSIGANANWEVEPIRLAFHNCGRLLYKLHGQVETMFTRCPFPPQSYSWDERVCPFIRDSQLYFIKPGNSVMWPPTNGFREWIKNLITQDKKILVMGGCTLNSCVRVSSSDTMEFFRDYGLRVVVDLSICGARTGNFKPSSQYGGLSSVESAIDYMRKAGVIVLPHVFENSN